MAFQLKKKKKILKGIELVSGANASRIESSRFAVLLSFYYNILFQI